MDWRDWLVVVLVVAVIASVAYRVGEHRGGGAQARLIDNSLWHVWAFAWFMYEGAGEPYGHNEAGVRRYAREQIEAEYGQSRARGMDAQPYRYVNPVGGTVIQRPPANPRLKDRG